MASGEAVGVVQQQGPYTAWKEPGKKAWQGGTVDRCGPVKGCPLHSGVAWVKGGKNEARNPGIC